MKLLLSKKHLHLTFLICLVCNFSEAQNTFIIEHFDYPKNVVLKGNRGWHHYNGSNEPIFVTNEGLSWSESNYIGSGIGNAAILNKNGKDYNKSFSRFVTSGSVYASFLIKINAITEGYFFHFAEYTPKFSGPDYSQVEGTHRARTFVSNGSTPETFKLGLTFNVNGVVDFSEDLNLGETYLVVVKYNIIEGSKNDEVSLFVFKDGDDISIEPEIPTIGPIVKKIGAWINSSDLTSVECIGLRQLSNNQNLTIDGIYVQDQWNLIPPSISEINNPTGVWALRYVGVGPTKGDVSWYSNVINPTEQPCMADDEFHFSADGTYRNALGYETWVEQWQGVEENGCNSPIYPHDGRNIGSWHNNENGTITITGVGNYLGLAKVINDGELTNPINAPTSITYDFEIIGDTMEVGIPIVTNDGIPGYWHFEFVNITPEPIETNPEGDWKMTYMGVGPSKGNVSQYSTVINENNRPCLADDIYSFNQDGSFTNNLGNQTWLETWQGASEDGCGSPVAPHDGNNVGYWSDNKNGTITIAGRGNFLGLAKVNNTYELDGIPYPGLNPQPAYDITYEVSVNNNILTADIKTLNRALQVNYWHFQFSRFGAASGNSVNNNKLKVYPNPTKDALWISNFKSGSLVTVRNINGIEVLRQIANEDFISVSSLKKGVYFIEVLFENEISINKFIKN